MSKVENSCKPRLKTILKQHHFNVNRAQKNKYSCTQILISVHMDRLAYMQNLRICKLKFALGLNQVQISRICIWCKFCIRVQIHSHGQICTREYICIYANICTRMQICPCESTFISLLASFLKKIRMFLQKPLCIFIAARKRLLTFNWYEKTLFRNAVFIRLRLSEEIPSN